MKSITGSHMADVYQHLEDQTQKLFLHLIFSCNLTRFMSFVPDPIMQSQNSNAGIAAVQEDCRDGTEKVLESAAKKKKVWISTKKIVMIIHAPK